MVCKNDALDVVKPFTRNGSTTGTSLPEYSNLLEYDFGTTDGFKKRLLKSENQIVDFQKATGEVFGDRLKCAMAPWPVRTYLRVQNRGDYDELLKRQRSMTSMVRC